MDEFSNTDLNVPQETLFPEDHNPITPLPSLPLRDSIISLPFSLEEQPTLPLVMRTAQQQRQLTDRISGPEVFLGEDAPFPSTGPITAVTEAAVPIARPEPWTYINTLGLPPIQLLYNAIISYKCEFEVTPSGIYIPVSLSNGIRNGLKRVFKSEDSPSGTITIPFPGDQETIQHIYIFIAQSLPKDRVICV